MKPTDEQVKRVLRMVIEQFGDRYYIDRNGDPCMYESILAANEMMIDYERPATPPAPEWDGEGLPPVGCECEVKSPANSEWHKCFVVGQHNGSAVFYCDNWTVESDYDSFPASEFRPIRTKEQREREELAELIASYMVIPSKAKAECTNAARAILARYELKERTNDNK